MSGHDRTVAVGRAMPYLQVADLEGVLAFYRDGLGWQIVDELRADGRRFWAQTRNGDAHLMLSDRPVHDRSRLTWLCVEDADAAHRELAARGAVTLSAPADQPHGNREFFVETPDGEAYVIAHQIGPVAG